MLPLHAVPPLLQFLVDRQNDLQRDENGGCHSNLKHLRLVCKYFNEVVTSAARGYCLLLSDQPATVATIEEQSGVAHLLRCAELDRLRVMVIVGPGKAAKKKKNETLCRSLEDTHGALDRKDALR